MKLTILIAALAILSVPIAAFAEAPVAKIATADLAELANNYDKIKNGREAVRAELRKVGQPVEQEFERWRTEAQNFNERVNSNADYLQTDEAQALLEQLRQREAELRQRLPDFDSYSRREQEIVESGLKDIQAAVQRVAERNGFNIVLDAAKIPLPQGVFYHSTPDITAEVLRELNGN